MIAKSDKKKIRVEAVEPGQITLNLHYDKNGSWLQVPKLMLYVMDLTPKDFSTFSFIEEDHMYLETDLDSPIFYRRFQFLYGDLPKTCPINHGKKAGSIRNLRRNSEGSDETLH